MPENLEGIHPLAALANREPLPKADVRVIVLADDIGHWPQLEAPDAVLTHFLAHIDRVTAGS